MIYTVADILPYIGEHLDGAGVDVDCDEEARARVLKKYNDFTRRLMGYGDWEGLEADICLPVCNCCVTLDRRIQSILSYSINNVPGEDRKSVV